MSTRLLILAAMLLAAPPAIGASTLFDDNAVIEAELSGPLDTIFKRKSEETREEYPFTLTAEGLSHDIRVRLRGKSRVRICTFPPLRLNFAGGAPGSVFEGQDKLKLVTHCTTSRYSEADVLEEYAVYRIFNLLAETGYRVRPLRIRYRDTEERVKGLDKPKYAFLIEAKQPLADRAGGKLAELPGVKRSELDPAHAALVYVFQYLVGNTDWSLAKAPGEESCCHNMTLLNIHSNITPVPYDFDMTGLVNAKYATPHPDLRRIDRVTQRLYRGYCTHPETLRAAIRQIVANREGIEQVIHELPELSDRQKKGKLGFLERFFKEAENEDRMIERFGERCVGRPVT